MIEISFSIMNGVQRMLVPAEHDAPHKEEHVIVPPHALVVLLSLYF